MRKTSYLLVALALLASACSGGAARECIAIADETITMLQDMITAVEALPPEDVPDSTVPAVLLGSLDTDTFFDLRGRADSLGVRSQEQGCEDAEGQKLVLDRVDQLQATTALGRTMRDGIISGIEQTQIN